MCFYVIPNHLYYECTIRLVHIYTYSLARIIRTCLGTHLRAHTTRYICVHCRRLHTRPHPGTPACTVDANTHTYTSRHTCVHCSCQHTHVHIQAHLRALWTGLMCRIIGYLLASLLLCEVTVQRGNVLTVTVTIVTLARCAAVSPLARDMRRCVCVLVCACVGMCVQVSACVGVCVQLSAYACRYLSVCVCVRVQVCVRL